MMRLRIDGPPAASRIFETRMNPLSTEEVCSPSTEKCALERKRETTLNAHQIHRRDDETNESCGQVRPSLQHVGVAMMTQ
jgi:hypothetical protein